MKHRIEWAAIVLAVAVAAALGFWFGRSAPQGLGATPPSSVERTVLYWYDPMVPDQRFDKPGKSPFMDMMLVPKYADEVSMAGVSIAPQIKQNLGIRTTIVGRGPLPLERRVPATLSWDVRAEHRMAARVEGVVERLRARAPFEQVRAGEVLATMLAPAWSSALAEYNSLAKGESAASAELLAAARERLRLLGLDERDIAAAGASIGVPRIHLRSPVDGVLSELLVREGEAVMAGQALFRVNGTRHVWLDAAVPESMVGLVAAEAPVDVEVQAFPGAKFSGTVERLLPEVDPITRTQIARVVIDNGDGRLAAGMFAEALMRVVAPGVHPLLPSEAVIRDGREARVIVMNEDGRFQPVPVRLGREDQGRLQVIEGLNGGERVVVSGQFLIDSEASLSGVQRRLEDTDAEPKDARNRGNEHHPGAAPPSKPADDSAPSAAHHRTSPSGDGS
jgi:membrane fusion protein, copper/silver efflux system